MDSIINLSSDEDIVDSQSEEGDALDSETEKPSQPTCSCIASRTATRRAQHSDHVDQSTYGYYTKIQLTLLTFLQETEHSSNCIIIISACHMTLDQSEALESGASDQAYVCFKWLGPTFLTSQ